MAKKSKQFADGKARNFIPGWIGGTLTSPEAQRIAKERLKNTLRERVIVFETARRNTSDADSSGPIFSR